MPTESTTALSVAVQVIACTLPVSHTSPPAGEVRLTAGAVTSMKVAVTLLAASIVRSIGLVVPTAAPDQLPNAQPGVALAVSCTTVP
jgi:hypothetical protein